MRVASIGECMVEFNREPSGLYRRSFGGDTLNTAVYLSRSGVAVDYVTALGDDPFSAEMLAAWAAEGVGTGLVVRVPGQLPGLYLIEVDDRGERQFSYWRQEAPARRLFALPGLDLDRLGGFDVLYLSGITLSLYDDAQRARLFDLLDRLRAGGGKVVFDGNYRPRGWPDTGQARAVFTRMLERTDLALPTFEDEQKLFGDRDAEATIARLQALGVAEIVVKRGPEPCLIARGAERDQVGPAAPMTPVDSTAAGDSFNAAYLAARLQDQPPAAAAAAGHSLAGRVISHRGAIIPRD